MSRKVALAVAALMIATSASAESTFHPTQDPTGATPILFDAMILRPIGFVVTVGGFIGFVVRSPIVAATRPQDIGKVWKEMVVKPAHYVWVDPLGYHPSD